jgi:hypothetical protein
VKSITPRSARGCETWADAGEIPVLLGRAQPLWGVNPKVPRAASHAVDGLSAIFNIPQLDISLHPCRASRGPWRPEPSAERWIAGKSMKSGTIPRAARMRQQVIYGTTHDLGSTCLPDLQAFRPVDPVQPVRPTKIKFTFEEGEGYTMPARDAVRCGPCQARRWATAHIRETSSPALPIRLPAEPPPTWL